MPPVGRRCHFSGGRPRQPHPPDIVAERSPWRKNGRVSKNRGEIPWQNTWQNVSRKKGSDQSGTCLSYGLRWNVLTVLSISIHQTSNSYAPRNSKFAKDDHTTRMEHCCIDCASTGNCSIPTKNRRQMPNSEHYRNIWKICCELSNEKPKFEIIPLVFFCFFGIASNSCPQNSWP